MKDPSIMPSARCWPSASKAQDRTFCSTLVLDSTSQLFMFHSLFTADTSINNKNSKQQNWIIGIILPSVPKLNSVFMICNTNKLSVHACNFMADVHIYNNNMATISMTTAIILYQKMHSIDYISYHLVSCLWLCFVFAAGVCVLIKSNLYTKYNLKQPKFEYGLLSNYNTQQCTFSNTCQ